MSIQCTNCGKEVEKGQCYEHQGRSLCEDCYMNTLSSLQACDPWAVHSAKTFLRGKDKLSTLTPLQEKIVDYIKGKGEAGIEEIMEKRIRCAQAHGDPERSQERRKNLFCIVLSSP